MQNAAWTAAIFFFLATTACVDDGDPANTNDPDPDAGTAIPDAGTATPDAGTPEEDASSPPEDAGSEPDDAGASDTDASAEVCYITEEEALEGTPCRTEEVCVISLGEYDGFCIPDCAWNYAEDELNCTFNEVQGMGCPSGYKCRFAEQVELEQ